MLSRRSGGPARSRKSARCAGGDRAWHARLRLSPDQCLARASRLCRQPAGLGRRCGPRSLFCCDEAAVARGHAMLCAARRFCAMAAGVVRVSLRLQINLLIAALIAVFVAVLFAMQVSDTRSSVREEIEAGNRV